MVAGRNKLIAEGEVSQRLLATLSIIQNVYCSWNPIFHRIEIEKARPILRSPTSSARVGTFFSGGLDSFYTLLKNQDQITDIIFVHGLDIKLNNKAYRQRISKSIQEVAAHFSKNLLEIETNLRDLLDPYITYGRWGWSIALAAVGHLLHPYMNRIYLPENYSHGNLFPCGSVVLPLWFTESFEFISHGLDVTRLEKISSISNHDIVLHNLRVCHKSPEGALNCGRCEKCLRTMIGLEVNNSLDLCTTFERDLDINTVKKIALKHSSKYPFYKQSLIALEESNGNEELAAVLRKVLKRPVWQNQIRRKFNKLTQKIFSKH
jgi:hypothetical protein